MTFLNHLLYVHRNQLGLSLIIDPHQVHCSGLSLKHYISLIVKLPFINDLLIVFVDIHLYRLLLLYVLCSNVGVVLRNIGVQSHSNLLSGRYFNKELRGASCLFKKILGKHGSGLYLSGDFPKLEPLLLLFSLCDRD